MNLVEKALRVAVGAHKEQVRKTDGSPYVVHPIMTAMLLREYDFEETTIAAAIVHDVLEDTNTTREELIHELGVGVVKIVTAVSEDKSLEWEDRKEQYVKEVANADVSVKAVSIADKVHNAESLIEHHGAVGKMAWEPFSRGKKEKLWFEKMLHREVNKTWDHPLMARYWSLITTLESLDD